MDIRDCQAGQHIYYRYYHGTAPATIVRVCRKRITIDANLVSGDKTLSVDPWNCTPQGEES